MGQHAASVGCVKIQGSETVVCGDCGAIVNAPTALSRHKKSQSCQSRRARHALQPDGGAKEIADAKEKVQILRDGIKTYRIRIRLAVMKQLSAFRAG